ncbi:MAG: helix-turn-helix domain-containing protein [Defluviitaleaceae bacterium]|nr:helix-turn-helix domain-containing protein [Defluviitaleaceae bacterium]
MNINPEKVGTQIAALRKQRQFTQSDLGERLNISFQAVSKWERGEALPDTSILAALAQALETTVDNILLGGEKIMEYKGKLAAKDMREGINCLERMGFLLGKSNPLYRYAIEGMTEKMDTDVASMLDDEYLRECLILEAIIQNMIMGYYFDPTEVKASFKHERWYNVFCDYAKKYDIV